MSAPSPFTYDDVGAFDCAAYVVPAALELIGVKVPPGGRILDIGCGNGSITRQFSAAGYAMTGIDISEDGIAIARRCDPVSRYEVGEVSVCTLDDLAADAFDAVLSTEVVEHLYDPLALALSAMSALRPGGRFVLSTPFHGRVKNTMIAASGKFDMHVNALAVGGHVKFFSRPTLSSLLSQAGFVDLEFRGTGRLPLMWKSMVMSGDRPSTNSNHGSPDAACARKGP